MTATDGVAAPGTGASGSRIDQLRDAIPEPARDIRLNLQSVLAPGTLAPEHRWGVAVASAVASRNRQVQEAVIGDARAEVSAAVIDDAVAAAALMAMNNVYYRFRHLVGKPSYAEKPARLRMNRLVKPATSKTDFELFSLAVSAINGCETCMRSHEAVVIEGGLTEDQVHDAIRLAATINAAAVSLEIAGVPAAAPPEVAV
jgi:alkyl hydroperoxide reductase subunit D